MGIEDVLPDRGHEVLGGLEALVVGEEDEVLGVDDTVGGEEQADLDLVTFEGGDRERSADVERLELGEREAVDTLESLEAELALRALGRPAEDECAVVGFEVRHRFDTEFTCRVCGDDEAVLVLSRGVVEHGDAGRFPRLFERGVGRFGIRRWCPAEERQHCADVFRNEVQLTALEGRLVDLACSCVQLALDGEAFGFQRLGVDLGDECSFAEVGRADRDRLATATGCGRFRRGRCFGRGVGFV